MFNFARKFFIDFAKDLLIYLLGSIIATLMTSIVLKVLDDAAEKRWASKHMSVKTHTNENSDYQSEE